MTASSRCAVWFWWPGSCPRRLPGGELPAGVSRHVGEDESRAREKQAGLERRGVWRFGDDRPADGKAGGIGGALFGLKDTNNFYGVTVDFSKDVSSVIRVLDGTVRVLGSAPVQRKNLPWHHVRVHPNTVLSKEFIETFFDGQLAVSVEDNALGAGCVGLMTAGEVPLACDNEGAIRMCSQRPLSAPPAF